MTTYKQIFIINTDLHMGKGKIAAQCSHGTTLYMESIAYGYKSNSYYERYRMWRDFGVEPIGTMPKIVLKASEEEMCSLCEMMDRYLIRNFKVFDLGKTQVESGSFTCICVEPLDEVQCDELFGHLKLL